MEEFTLSFAFVLFVFALPILFFLGLFVLLVAAARAMNCIGENREAWLRRRAAPPAEQFRVVAYVAGGAFSGPPFNTVPRERREDSRPV
jgi:hypothetical protein